jgi:hypothetical protein
MANASAISFSSSRYGLPLTSAVTRLIVLPENAKGDKRFCAERKARSVVVARVREARFGFGAAEEGARSVV